MENVQFDEEIAARPFDTNQEKKLSLLTRLFIKTGLAKDQRQANNTMILISIICLLLMSYFIVSTFFPNLLNFSKSKPTQTTTSNPWETNSSVNK